MFQNSPKKNRHMLTRASIAAFVVAIGALSMFAGVGINNDVLHAQETQSSGKIRSISPSSSNIVIGVGDTVQLSINVYGLQNVQDRSLGNDDDFSWSASGGTISGDANGTSITYQASSSAGNYTVTASAGSACVGTASECTATFRISVRRYSQLTSPEAPPRNPDGDVPAILTDSDGRQYEVFTPEEGGSFTGEGFSITADPGIVPNHEIIGIRMCESGNASNAGMSEHRYTLSGNWYQVCAVDGTGKVISNYRLDGPAEVCIPVPDQLRSDIADVGVFGMDSNGDLIGLTSSVRIMPDLIVCGNLSTLPATLAAGVPGTPPEPTATPEPAPEPADRLPPTGGTAPTSSHPLVWSMLIGFALLVVSSAVFVAARRRETAR